MVSNSVSMMNCCVVVKSEQLKPMSLEIIHLLFKAYNFLPPSNLITSVNPC